MIYRDEAFFELQECMCFFSPECMNSDPRVVVMKSIPRVAQSVSKMAEGL